MCMRPALAAALLSLAVGGCSSTQDAETGSVTYYEDQNDTCDPATIDGALDSDCPPLGEFEPR